ACPSRYRFASLGLVRCTSPCTLGGGSRSSTCSKITRACCVRASDAAAGSTLSATGEPPSATRIRRTIIQSAMPHMLPRSIDRDEVRRLTDDEDAQLVEVLPAREFGEEHIVGAVNIPLKDLDERAPLELDRERPVIVYCNDYQ